MRRTATAPFTAYSEQHVQELIGRLDGQVIQVRGRAIPISTFINDAWQSAKREGYIEGHVQTQSDHYHDVHGHKPPASTVGDWRKHAGRKAMCSEDNDSS
jgi:hypothetical protein